MGRFYIMKIAILKKGAHMGRRGCGAGTGTALKPVKQWEQLGRMRDWKFEVFENKNPYRIRLREITQI